MWARVGILAWAGGLSLLLGVMMARHAAPFKVPNNLNTIARGLASEQLSNRSFKKGTSKAIAVHILDPRCACSRTVLDRLKALRDTSVRHVVWLVSKPNGSVLRNLHDLKGAGVELKLSDPEQAKEQFKVETVPWFVVLSSELEILYSGGYARSQIRGVADLQMDQILTRAKQGDRIGPLPSYGCVTSQELRKALLESGT